jgi:hypothetical protein
VRSSHVVFAHDVLSFGYFSVAQTDWLGGTSFYSNLEEGETDNIVVQLVLTGFYSWKLLVCMYIELCTMRYGLIITP